MLLVPAVTPVRMPELLPIVATPVTLLIHSPPEVLLDRELVAVSQTASVPVIAATVGKGLTVTDVVASVVQLNPFVTLYVMSAVPADSPVTIPVLLPTEAIALLLLVHIPLAAALARVVVLLSHTVVVPVMAGTVGYGLIVIVALP